MEENKEVIMFNEQDYREEIMNLISDMKDDGYCLRDIGNMMKQGMEYFFKGELLKTLKDIKNSIDKLGEKK